MRLERIFTIPSCLGARPRRTESLKERTQERTQERTEDRSKQEKDAEVGARWMTNNLERWRIEEVAKTYEGIRYMRYFSVNAPQGHTKAPRRTGREGTRRVRV